MDQARPQSYQETGEPESGNEVSANVREGGFRASGSADSEVGVNIVGKRPKRLKVVAYTPIPIVYH